MTYTRKDWATAFLHALGNTKPTEGTIMFVCGWGAEEGGGFTNTCAYNILNTMHRVPGSVDCTDIGIQAYKSFEDGVVANVHALKDSFYPHLLTALQNNDEHALGMASDLQSVSPEIAGDLSVWVSGKRDPVHMRYIENILKCAHDLHSAAATAAGGPERTYIVKSGDTLSGIAAKFGLTWQALYAANKDVIGPDPNVIRRGQKLLIPL